MLVGTVVTVLSVIVPAFRAGRTKPVEAMRSTAGRHVRHLGGARRVRAVFLVLSIVAAAGEPVRRRTVVLPGARRAAACSSSLFVAGPLLARVFAKVVTPLLGAVGLTGRLAADNSVRNPKRTATTANALVIGLFLVTLVTVSGEAMKSYIVGEFNKLSSSDFIVGAERALDPELVEGVRDTEGVTGVAAAPDGHHRPPRASPSRCSSRRPTWTSWATSPA